MKYEFFWYDNGDHNDQLSLERAEEEMILFNSDISALYAMASSEDAKTRANAAWNVEKMARQFYDLTNIYSQFKHMDAWSKVNAAIQNTLNKLSSDEEPLIRAEVARCAEYLAKEVVVTLASDSNEIVRWNVAELFREQYSNYACLGNPSRPMFAIEVDFICDWLIKTSGGIIVENVDTI